MGLIGFVQIQKKGAETALPPPDLPVTKKTVTDRVKKPLELVSQPMVKKADFSSYGIFKYPTSGDEQP